MGDTTFIQSLSVSDVRKKTQALLGSDVDLSYLTNENLESRAVQDLSCDEEVDENGLLAKVIYGHGLHVGYRNGYDTFEYWRGDSTTDACGESNKKFIYQQCWTYAKVGTCTTGGVSSGKIKFSKRRECW